MADEEATYNIIRFHKDGSPEVIKEGLTFEEAQEHCNDSSSQGFGWFDGYTKVED